MRFYFLFFALFIILGCGGPDKSRDLDSSYIYGEIMVTVSDITADELVSSIKKPKFTVKETLSRRMKIYLLAYDSNKYKPSKALQILKNHNNVKSAEFNKKVQLRR